MANRSSLFGAVLLVLSLGALGPADPVSSAQIASVVSAGSDADIANAIQSADEVRTVRVKPGRYGELSIGKNANPLTIESVDPLHPATFDGITIGSATHVTLRNLVVERRAGQPLRQQLVFVRRSSSVALENLRLSGPSELERGREYAVMIRDSDDVRLVGSSIGGTRYGVGMLDSRNVAIERNEFRELQTDGIRGGGVDDLLIANNVLGHFSPKPGEHPDGIQLWSTNQKTPAKRIVIRDNLIVRDGGGITQGIFVRDTLLTLPFEALEIRGNLAIGTMYNGISVQGATEAAVTGNEVIAFSDQKSWIRLQSVDGGELTNNRAMQFVQIASDGVRVSGNRTTQPLSATSGDFRDRIRAWVAASSGRQKQLGPYLHELTDIDDH